MPLNLAYLAAYIRKYDEDKHEFKIIDEAAGDDVEKDLKEFKPDVVGISATTPQVPKAIEVAKFVKENFNIPVIIGGVHTTVLPEQTLKEGGFDIGVVGEGEATFLELIQILKKIMTLS